jgi:hypothetical protein
VGKETTKTKKRGLRALPWRPMYTMYWTSAFPRAASPCGKGVAVSRGHGGGAVVWLSSDSSALNEARCSSFTNALVCHHVRRDIVVHAFFDNPRIAYVPGCRTCSSCHFVRGSNTVPQHKFYLRACRVTLRWSPANAVPPLTCATPSTACAPHSTCGERPQARGSSATTT